MAAIQEINGSCHCGAITYRFFTDRTPAELSVRPCTCSFCTRHGAVYTSDPGGRLEITAKDPSSVNRYSFGHETAAFLVCGKCGVVTAAISEIEGNTYAVVNINVCDQRDKFLSAPTPGCFDGESRGDRLARRKRNWIGSVAMIPADFDT